MTLARDQLRSIIDRVLRLKEEQDAIGEDVREVYAEAKSNGYDKTTLGKAVAVIRARRKKGEAAVAEADALLDMYLSAYDGTERATRTHAHARAQENPGDGLAGHSAPVEPSSGASPAPAGRAAEASPATLRVVADDKSTCEPIPAFLRRTA